MSDIAGLLEELRTRWRSAGIEEHSGAGLDDVRAFEERYEVQLCQDLVQYFTTVDGMPEGALDDELFYFYPLAKVHPVTTVLPVVNDRAYQGYFVFADYSLWAHGYAIRLSPPHDYSVALVADTVLEIVADSFRTFLDKYLHKQWSILK